MEDTRYYMLTLRQGEEPGGMYDFDMCVKSYKDLEFEFSVDPSRIEAFLGDDLNNGRVRLHVASVELLTDEEAAEMFDLSNADEWPIYGQQEKPRGARRIVLPKMQGGAVMAKNGFFDVVAGLETDYPGVDVEFHVRGSRNCTQPRIVFEEAEGQLRVLIWSDPDSEDYTHEFAFNLDKYKRGGRQA